MALRHMGSWVSTSGQVGAVSHSAGRHQLSPAHAQAHFFMIPHACVLAVTCCRRPLRRGLILWLLSAEHLAPAENMVL